jgi:hypothetical protein
MKNSYLLSLVLVSVLLLASCGGKKDEEKETEKETKPGAVETLQQFTDKAKDKGTVDPVDFRKLKELLPNEVEGLKRTEATGEKSGAMGFIISRAEARYSDKDNKSVHLEILDTGGVAGVATMALAAWTMADIDKETTMTVKVNPAN